jgi:hypothetical protein
MWIAERPYSPKMYGVYIARRMFAMMAILEKVLPQAYRHPHQPRHVERNV